MFEFSGSYITNRIDTRRITALWAFSETALGGILHVLKIPFTGLFIGSAAVLFICLLAQYGKSKSEIIKATLIVILVKAIVTPYVPLNSYLAVTLQGVLGFLFFTFVPIKNIAAILLGIFALFFAALQKFIMMTILFGNTIWESFDTLAKFILNQIPFLHGRLTFSVSLILISFYTALHVLAGIYMAIRATHFDKWLLKKSEDLEILKLTREEQNGLFERPKSKKRKRWWQRKSGIIILSISVVLMIISYLFPHHFESSAYDILFMLIRSIVITFVWFTLVSPLAVKLFKLFIEKKKFEHAGEVNNITELFPNFKNVVSYCWRLSSSISGYTRYRKFLSDSLALLLLTDL